MNELIKTKIDNIPLNPGIYLMKNKNDDAHTKLKCQIANTLGQSKNSSCVLSLLYVLNDKNENYKKYIELFKEIVNGETDVCWYGCLR